jgi:hypothetical protein
VSPGRLVVSVADSCLTCGALDLNLHADAFAQLATPAAAATGALAVRYRVVACPAFGEAPHVGAPNAARTALLADTPPKRSPPPVCSLRSLCRAQAPPPLTP